MKTLKALKSRREGIEKINKIARAMEVIAATRLRRFEERTLRFRPYILAQQSLIENLTLRLKKIKSIWTEPVKNKKGLAILISSDRGFCGGFNNQLFQLIKNLNNNQSFSFIAVGKKGATFLKKHNFNLIFESALPQLNQMSEIIQSLSEKIISNYCEERQRIYLIFNKFRRNLLGQSFLRQLFPLQAHKKEEVVLDYLVEPDMEVLLEELLFLYVHSEIKAAILESKAAEEMARMVAMTQATRSAEDLIKGLTLEYHKARQAGITKELIEIANAVTY